MQTKEPNPKYLKLYEKIIKACRSAIGRKAGKVKSEKKSKSSAENGRKYGGRPKKKIENTVENVNINELTK